MMKKLALRSLGVLSLLTLSACSLLNTPPENDASRVQFEASSFEALPPSDPAAWEGALAALKMNCTRIAARQGWQSLCQDLAQDDPKDAQAFFQTHFTPYRVLTKAQKTGLMTGYYEPLLKGSKTRHGPYQYPLYTPPSDLIIVDLASLYPQLKGLRLRGKLQGRHLVPYDTRQDIEERSDLPAQVLAWVNDPAEAFFLQIQGSGRIELEDHSLIRVGYADQNGHPYKAIGKTLIERGALKPNELSMQSIQAWARAHPNALASVLNTNPSYVFFNERFGDPKLGPIGALGVPLTPESSVAVDTSIWQLGIPFFINAEQTNPNLHLARPVVAQDTGGAIRGPIRFDFFWGYGDEAGQQAGRQKSDVLAWVLVPKSLTPEALLKPKHRP